MKWLKMVFLSLALCGVVACDDDKTVNPNPQLEVTPNNLAGGWELVSYDNGATLPEGCYVQIEFERKECTYILRQNTESFSEQVLTGSFNILTEPELGAILVGNYDYKGGEWAHRYIVTSLTAQEMMWEAKDDRSQRQLFRRIQ